MPNLKIIEFEWDGQKYEIKDTKREQKARLIKGKDMGGKNIVEKSNLVVKNYQENFYNHTAEINGKKETIKWKVGKITFSVLGTVLVIVFFSYLIWTQEKNPKWIVKGKRWRVRKK